jgi:hypothetical protein
MLIDCDTCAVRDLACGDCVVTHLLSTAAPTAGGTGVGVPVELATDEAAALAVLADSGLVPPLRLARAE